MTGEGVYALIEKIRLAATVAISKPEDSDWARGYHMFALHVLTLIADHEDLNRCE